MILLARSVRSLGLAAALVAATVLSAVAVAQPTVVVAERGDLALVPYYTVRGQWVTGIHIVNTSDMTQVVKFRLRRATDGMNALDFNLVMSPRDVYAGFLGDDENGNISWTSPDTTCTAPATWGNRFTMPPIYRAGAESGYVEIIAMGQTLNERQPIAVAARHSATTSMPLDCAAVRSNFFADGRAAVVADPANNVAAVTGKKGVLANNQTYQPGMASASNDTVKTGGTNTYMDSGNVLKVSYFIRDNGTGIEFGDNAVHIANFLNAPSITNQQYGVSAGDLNGLDFPDLNGAGMPGGSMGRTRFFPELSKGAGMPGGGMGRTRFNRLRRAGVLGATRIINEWSANPANGVQMDWVITLPGQYTMLNLPQYLASLGADRAWVPTVDSTGNAMDNPGCPRTAIPVNTSTGMAAVAACDFRDLPIELTLTPYNRDGGATMPTTPTGTLVPGPQPPAPPVPKISLAKVANVITFGGNSVLGQRDANVNADLGQPFGWVKAKLTPQKNPGVCDWSGPDSSSPSASAAASLSMVCSSAATVIGGNAPVIGFAAWARKVAANPDASYGRIVEHSYPASASVPAPAPGAPTNLSATAGDAQVELSWAAVSGATRYTVYYSTSTIGDITASSVRSVAATSTSATVTNLPNGTLHYFVVTATTADGESAASSEASATPQVPPPGAPTNLSVTAGNGQVAISWTAVSGATGYTVYYSTSTISDITASSVRSVSTTSTSATVTNLPSGTLHYFVVTASNAGGESVASSEAFFVQLLPPPPGAPTNLSATAGNAEVELSWAAVSGATGYTVYYSTSTISDITASSVRSVAATSTSATVTNLPNGTLHYFVVTATTADGESAASSEASTTPTLVTGFVVFRDALSGGGEGPQMVVLPTGNFTMGSPSTETGRLANEGPTRTVTISNRIAMGRYEVTFEDYKRFTDDSTTTQTLPDDQGWGRGTRPVMRVSWNDAKAYARWLSTQTSKSYRLPSESEWEYAARAGTDTAYSFGNTISCSQARYGHDGGDCSSTRYGGTVPVGSFVANAFGLFDMHGNVAEFVEDCHVNTYTGAPSDGSARTTGCGANVLAVVRGGGWGTGPRFLRAATRNRLFLSFANNNTGFRLVRDLNP